MNAQERDQLLQFLTKLRQQRAGTKDPVADGLVRDALAQQADASYCLVQRALALTLALQAARVEIGQLSAQLASHSAALSEPMAADPSAHMRVQRHPTSASAKQVAGPASAAHGAAPLSSAWGRGLLAQGAGLALGVATGVVAGGLLLQGISALDSGAAPAEGGGAAADLSDLSDADGALWDWGEDWA